MPNSITKNKLNNETLNLLIQTAFPNRSLMEWIELTEGFFNVAYLVRFKDGEELILKIAPDASMEVMTHEINIMYSEVDSIQMINHQGIIPVPEVVLADFSRSIILADFFFMRKLPGSSFMSQMEALSQEDKDEINRKIGAMNRQINDITGAKFGYYGQKDKQGASWYLVFSSILKDAVNDAVRKSIALPADEKELFLLLAKDKMLFDEVSVPRLIHWDLWAGNVFVKDGQITGLIDFERCLWGDILMEVGFRSCFQNPAFIKGYGIEELSASEQRRILWYDIYLFVICCLECDYREYDTRDTYQWGSSMLLETVSKIRDNK
ncbi:MAG: aminoglycoside phosphotransferase [Herbinix sp.]|nr:aminoglycoside phosphotransferase [Herbinix sp.]